MTTKAGFYWHVHHGGKCPAEYCYDYAERVRVIETQKPEAERPTRLARFKPVSWPDMPGDVVAPLATLKKAGAAWEKARAALVKAEAALVKAGAAMDKAGAAWNKAGAALDKVLLAHMPEILALHAAQCPGCPWSAATDIFGNKG